MLADRVLGLVATLLVALTGLLFIGKSLDNKLIVWAVSFVFILTIAIIAVLLRKNNKLLETRPSEKKAYFIL